MFETLVVILLAANLAVLVRVWLVKRDARDSLAETRKLAESSYQLLGAMKEYFQLGKAARDDARHKGAADAEKVAAQVEQIPERTAVKVVEKIKEAGESAGDSGKLPTVRLPPQP